MTKERVRRWRCFFCGKITKAVEPPAPCPKCGKLRPGFIDADVSEIVRKSSQAKRPL